MQKHEELFRCRVILDGIQFVDLYQSCISWIGCMLTWVTFHFTNRKIILKIKSLRTNLLSRFQYAYCWIADSNWNLFSHSKVIPQCLIFRFVANMGRFTQQLWELVANNIMAAQWSKCFLVWVVCLFAMWVHLRQDYEKLQQQRCDASSDGVPQCHIYFWKPLIRFFAGPSCQPAKS